jgi:hypothetical protein
MSSIFIFDGVNKLISTQNNVDTFSTIDLYSAWKLWVQESDNSKFVEAIFTIGGEPIGGGQSVSPYFFLNTPAGWRMQAYGRDHELKIVGNLFSVDSSLPIFIPTVGYTVLIAIERSSSALDIGSGRFIR